MFKIKVFHRGRVILLKKVKDSDELIEVIEKNPLILGKGVEISSNQGVIKKKEESLDFLRFLNVLEAFEKRQIYKHL